MIPISGTGCWILDLMEAAALGSTGLGYGPGINFMIMPIKLDDMQKIQAIDV